MPCQERIIDTTYYALEFLKFSSVLAIGQILSTLLLGLYKTDISRGSSVALQLTDQHLGLTFVGSLLVMAHIFGKFFEVEEGSNSNEQTCKNGPLQAMYWRAFSQKFATLTSTLVTHL